MRPTRLFQDRLRDSSALLITAALHLGVAAIALVAVTVAVPKPKPPIMTRTIPETIVPPAPVPTPNMREQDVGITVDKPIIDIEPLPAPTPWPDTRPNEPEIAGSPLDYGSGTTAADPVPPRVAGPTRAARFDPRHTAAAQPPYPPAARRLGEEGSVIVHVTIGRDGRVLAATVAQSSGSPRLDAAAVEQALKRWRFTPALADGEAVEAARDITVRFRLADA